MSKYILSDRKSSIFYWNMKSREMFINNIPIKESISGENLEEVDYDIFISGFDKDILKIIESKQNIIDIRGNYKLLDIEREYHIYGENLISKNMFIGVIEWNVDLNSTLEDVKRLKEVFTIEENLGKQLFNRNHITCITLDLDNFNRINSKYSYAIGDNILKIILVKLKNILDIEDKIFRVTGNRFLIILTNERYIEISKTIEKIYLKIQEPIVIKESYIHITGSIGVASQCGEKFKFYELVKNSEIAMRISKNSEKNTYTVFNQNILNSIEREKIIKNNLKNSLENKELYVLFQPKVELYNNKVTGFEALVRWNSKELGEVLPSEMIPVAEETKAILKIGTFVLEEVFKKIKELLDDEIYDFKIGVNLSEIQLRHNTILRDLKELSKKYEIDLKYIELEITESVLMESFDYNIKILEEIKRLGVTIALDDFGTGYSSLSYLSKLPIDVVKIDKSFVKDLKNNYKSRCIVESIVNLSHNLGIFVVAEGVEDKEQLKFLNSIFCDVVQGYYFSKPKESNSINKLVGKKIEK